MIKQTFNREYSPYHIVIYTAAAASIFLAFIIATGFTNQSLFGVEHRSMIIPSLAFCWIALTTTFYGIVNFRDRDDLNSRLLALASLGGTSLVLLEISHIVESISSESFYYTYLMFQVFLSYSLGYLLTSALQVRGKWPKLVASAYAGIILFSGIIGLLTQSWVPYEQSQMLLFLFRCGLITLLPFILVGALFFANKLNLSSKQLANTIILRLNFTAENKNELYFGIGIWLVSLIAIVGVSVLFFSNQLTEQWKFIKSISLSIFPILIYSIQISQKHMQGNRKNLTTSALVTPSAKRFMLRHITTKSAWAATVGFRTPSFTINHDPGNAISTKLPATMVQIRRKEIRKCVASVLENCLLQNRIAGNQVIGIIDPELSFRPCVDVLTMFACLHMDAVPLVERRLTGLGKLLPILDPNLAELISSEDIEKALSYNLWLYHFDFDWTDQHIVSTPSESHYGVMQNERDSKFKNMIFEYLLKKNQMGSFIWIGQKARERIIQEAPMLSEIIQAWPVTTSEGEEQLVFLIKFEELIPRLQTYYHLDSRRNVLKDFEATKQSSSYLNIVELQLQNCTTLHSIYSILDSITNFPWQGYKEKDLALTALTKAFHMAQKIDSAKAVASIGGKEKIEEIRERFIESTLQIGYPSQILHLAQKSKIDLRSADSLIRTASTPWSPRCQEAWLTIAAGDFQRNDKKEVIELMEFLSTASNNKHLKSNLFILAKSIEGFTNLGSHLDLESEELISKTLNSFATWLTELNSPLDVCTLFLDARLFIERKFSKPFPLTEKSTENLNTYFEHLKNQTGIAQQDINAIYSRWNILQNKTSFNAA